MCNVQLRVNSIVNTNTLKLKLKMNDSPITGARPTNYRQILIFECQLPVHFSFSVNINTKFSKIMEILGTRGLRSLAAPRPNPWERLAPQCHGFFHLRAEVLNLVAAILAAAL